MSGNPARLGPLPWALHPWPRKDELLVSWVVRFAAANRLTPRQLVAFLADTEAQRIRAFEPLVRVHQALVSKISGVPLHQLDLLISRQPPMGEAKTLTYRCCPLCLVEGTEPYLRSAWMQLETLVCVKHRTLLSDRCDRCDTPWAWRIFGPRDHPASRDLLRCTNPRCRADVRHSAFGTLAEDHGAVWLQAQLSHPEQTSPILLPSGKRLTRPLLQAMLATRSHLLPSWMLLPFDLEEGLYPWRNAAHRRGSHSWLFLAQMLVQPSWLWEELLTATAERLARDTAYRRRPLLLSPSRPVIYYREVLTLLFFTLVYDPQVQLIDRTTLLHHDFSNVLQTFERTLGLNGQAILRDLPAIYRRLP